MNTYVMPRLLALAYLSAGGDKQAQHDMCDLLETIGHDSADTLMRTRLLVEEIRAGETPEWLEAYRASGARLRRAVADDPAEAQPPDDGRREDRPAL